MLSAGISPNQLFRALGRRHFAGKIDGSGGGFV
jgi:hypothetical protein